MDASASAGERGVIKTSAAVENDDGVPSKPRGTATSGQ